MSSGLLLPVVVALLVSLSLPLALRPLLTRLAVIDVPNERSSHTAPVLRGGGVAPTVGLVAGGVVALALLPASAGAVTLLIVIIVATAAAGLGLIEDVWGVPVVIRAGIQLLIGLAGAAAVVVITGAPGWMILVGGFAVATYINVANFMDGINGISGLHGLVVGITYAIVGGMYELNWMIIAGLCVAAIFAAFLPWNLAGNGMFLGDVGSYLLGGSIAVIAVAAVLQGIPVVAVLGPLAIYLADSGLTLLRRVMAGERWFEAHRSHVYQRLVTHRSNHLRVGVLVALLTAGTGVAGMGVVHGGGLMTAASVLAIALITGVYLVIPTVIGRNTRLRALAGGEDRND